MPTICQIQHTNKVEVNKEGQIEVKESQDVLQAAVSKALESCRQIEQSLGNLNSEEPRLDLSVATDLTASPTDSHPKTITATTPIASTDDSQALEDFNNLDKSGNDSALGESTTEVSAILSLKFKKLC